MESASGNPDLKFWETVIKRGSNGSGPGYVTGWMSTFNVFTKEGKWRGSNFRCKDGNGEWPAISDDSLSLGVCQVPVHIQDFVTEEWTVCKMFAGMYRTEIQNSNTLVPTNDWFIAAPNQSVIDAVEAKNPKERDLFWAFEATKLSFDFYQKF